MSVVKRGDTIIEVVLSFVMFSLVAAISISVMHAGISSAEASIELTLARVEIDAQSEAMRFIQESYANDRSYPNLWRAITNRAILGQKVDGSPSDEIPELAIDDCSKLYSNDISNLNSFKAFILNSRQINNGVDENKDDWVGYTVFTPGDDFSSSYAKFSTSSLNPRVIYTTKPVASSDDETTDSSLMEGGYKYIYRAEGIYDFIVKDTSDENTKPSHYDFYVYTCWFTPGAERPTTIGTVSRLYNPEYLNAN